MVKVSERNGSQEKNGKWKEFNKHAILISEGCYLNGKKEGAWREYYDHNGALMIEEQYRCGLQHGRYACYHPGGQLLSEGQYINGMRDGFFNVYDEDGKNIRKLFFINNVEIHDSGETQFTQAEETSV